MKSAKKRAVIILPTYNERHNIVKLIDKIMHETEHLERWETHIMVVDSASPDGTGDAIQEIIDAKPERYPNLHLIKTKKEGLGKAYLQGFRTAIDELQPAVLFEMDADHSHDPKHIPPFLQKIEEGADFVIGSRYISGGSIPKDWALHRKMFSVLGNWIIRFGFMKLRITDWTSGFRAMKVWIVQKSLRKLEGYTGYVFQVALLDNAIKAKAVMREVPIRFVDRTEGQSKINSTQYIFQTLLYVFQHSSFIKFCIVGGMGFIVDFSFAYLFIQVFHFPKVLSNMMSAEIAIISNFMFNNYWSFAHKRIRRSGSIFLSLLKFNLVSSGSVFIQGSGMWLALNILGDHILHIGSLEFHSWIVYKVIIILMVIIPYSYFFYNRFVWKEKS